MREVEKFLEETAELTANELGIFTRLLCHQWVTGSLPSEPERLVILAGPGFTEAWPALRPHFMAAPDGRIGHYALAVSRQKAVAGYEAKRAAGRKGAEKRWRGNGAKAPPLGVAAPPAEQSPPVSEKPDKALAMMRSWPGLEKATAEGPHKSLYALTQKTLGLYAPGTVKKGLAAAVHHGKSGIKEYKEVLGNVLTWSRVIGSHEFELAWAALPAREGTNSKQDALKAWNARIKEGADADEVVQGARRYATWCGVTGKTGTELAMQGKTFFGPAEHWKNEYKAAPEVQTDVTKAKRERFKALMLQHIGNYQVGMSFDEMVEALMERGVPDDVIDQAMST